MIGAKKEKHKTTEIWKEKNTFFPALAVGFQNNLLKHLYYLKIDWTEHFKTQHVFIFHVGNGINLII